MFNCFCMAFFLGVNWIFNGRYNNKSLKKEKADGNKYAYELVCLRQSHSKVVYMLLWKLQPKIGLSQIVKLIRYTVSLCWLCLCNLHAKQWCMSQLGGCAAIGHCQGPVPSITIYKMPIGANLTKTMNPSTSSVVALLVGRQIHWLCVLVGNITSILKEVLKYLECHVICWTINRDMHLEHVYPL